MTSAMAWSCVLAIALTAAVAASPFQVHRRALQQNSVTTIPGPEVYQYIVPVFQGESPLNLTVLSQLASNQQCTVTGILGSPGSTVPNRGAPGTAVPGPIIFSLPPALTAFTVNFQSPDGALFALSSSIDVVVTNSTGAGLTRATYYKDSTPTSHGNVTGTVIPNYNSGQSIANQYQSCLVNITFVTAPPSPAPAPARSTPLVLPTG